MEIREANSISSVKTVPKRPVIVVRNKNKLGHDECCNCCSSSKPMYYKYFQPPVPKSFAPIRLYRKSDVPLDANTTYKLSFWDGPRTKVRPYRPKSTLKVDKCPFIDDTTQKLSYLGNWCVKPEEPIKPCSGQLFHKGRIECATTQKCDFTRKNVYPTKPIKERPNLYRPNGAMENETTYRKSYYESACLKRVKPFKPVRRYVKSNVPMDGCTTYKLSYWANEIPMKETYPWGKPLQYKPPTSKLDSNTTYKLSFYGGKSDRRSLIKQPLNMRLPDCPLSTDTVNRLSYLGNWCFKPESSMKPCASEALVVKGPMQKETTNKSDYYWKQQPLESGIIHQDNLQTPSEPLNCSTTQKMSYMPIDTKCLLPVKSFAPVRKYKKSDVPLETETIQRLSYQQVEPVDKVEITWKDKGSYRRPTTAMEDNTTYNQSYDLPGMLVPLSQCEIESLKRSEKCPEDRYRDSSSKAHSEMLQEPCVESSKKMGPRLKLSSEKLLEQSSDVSPRKVSEPCVGSSEKLVEPCPKWSSEKLPEPSTNARQTKLLESCPKASIEKCEPRFTELPVIAPKKLNFNSSLLNSENPYFAPCLMSMPRPCIACG